MSATIIDRIISEPSREILRRVEDRLPDGKLYDEVLSLRLLVDRAIEERKQQPRA